jgi:hypothetical protein
MGIHFLPFCLLMISTICDVIVLCEKSEVQTSLECSLTQGKSVGCLVSEWSVSADGCAEQECDEGGVVQKERVVTVHPMCGGKACGA